MQIDYQLTPKHVAAYQYAVRDRMRAMTGTGGMRERLSYAALALLTCLLLIGGDVALEHLTGARTSPWALVFGLIVGAAITIGTYWIQYFGQRSRIVQPGGPTLKPHTMDAGDARLSVQAESIESSYAWCHFEAVTEHADILVLWIEPALGLFVPRDAFANACQRERVRGAGRSTHIGGQVAVTLSDVWWHVRWA
jgi:hypothetical protein